MFYKKVVRSVGVIALALALAQGAVAADWPMWRYDANRSAASPGELPGELRLQWVLELPQLEPAWPRGDGAVTGFEDMDLEDGFARRMTFDIAYAPVVVGKTMFVGSSFNDSIRAYDTETAVEKWRFYAGAPIRFAPAVANGKVYFTSDDGYLYCLDAGDGGLVWRFRGGPSDRKVLGNKRLGSTWPARGGPVVADGKVYFAVGIWPFMGAFIYALDAESGDVLWINDGSATRWMRSPHSGAYAFNAVAPQGYLVAIADKLLIPNGRAVAAAFDRDTGDYLYFWFGENGRNGTAHAAAIGDYFQNSGRLYNLSDGLEAEGLPDAARMADGAALTQSTIYERIINKTGEPEFCAIRAVATDGNWTEKWVYPTHKGTEALCKAGNLLYAGSPGRVIALEVSGDSAELRWEKSVAGTPESILAADNKLFVATEEGSIYCFGERAAAVAPPSRAVEAIAWPSKDKWVRKAKNLLARVGEDEGYCLVLGVGTGRLMEELTRQSELRVIGLDPNATKVEELRQRWDDMGVPAERLSVLVGDICSLQLPPYMANLITSEDVTMAGTAYGDLFVERVFHSLRPYGGTACFSANLRELFEQGVAAADLANAEVSRSWSYTLLARAGALPGTADWTHQYADPANTLVSKDKLVKAPLGLLWFGGSSNKQILPRHRHGPSPQVVDGRLLIEGPDIMRGVDVYTGRVLWEVDLPGVGEPFVKRPIIREHEEHEPGANHLGSNYASVSDGVYIAHGSQVLRLEPATGETISTFDLPGQTVFAQVKVWDDLLILTAEPVIFDDKPIGEDNWNATCSRKLLVKDRYSGETIWGRTADNAFHHNTIIVGDGKLFCIDRLPPGQEAMLDRRGMSPADVGAQYKLSALCVRTGGEIWSTTEDIFGTWLGYSEEHDILLQSGRDSEDMVSGDVLGRLITYRGSDGMVVWDTDAKASLAERGPYLLHGRTIYMQEDDYDTSGALDLLTGDVRTRTDPLTGETVPWRFIRNKGCGTQTASEYLMTFRSGTGAYYDLTNNGGVGSIGGIKSGCTSNLILANGVLNAPDYTRSCNCSYQNQTSLALVHMPEVEVWTNGAVEATGAPVERAGVNFGAPGDRVADNGVLWMEYPVPQYGDSAKNGLTFPNLDIQTTPAEVGVFRHHSSRFNSDDGMAWVVASGAVGLSDVKVKLGNAEEQPYTVRLYFAEPQDIASGQRLFSVQLQGNEVLSDFDIAQAAGGARKAVVREFAGVNVADTLEVQLVPSSASPIQAPLLCGIEVLAESGEVTVASAKH